MAAITTSIDRSAFLRRVLVIDAATCVAMGLLFRSAQTCSRRYSDYQDCCFGTPG